MDFVKSSFYITYILLLTTGTITFIEAISTHDINVRHIMNLETCISIVAAYFYSLFIAKLDKQPTIDYKEINTTRYTDWFITTPLMLLVLCLVLSFNDKTKFHILSYVIIVALNYGMLITGYMGETQAMDKRAAQLVSFVFFFILFWYIWHLFIRNHYTSKNLVIYGAFFILWFFYGLIYMAKEDTKNITFNILDMFAKCFVGIFFWMYFAKVLVI